MLLLLMLYLIIIAVTAAVWLDYDGALCDSCQQQGCRETNIQLAGSYCENLLFSQLPSE